VGTGPRLTPVRAASGSSGATVPNVGRLQGLLEAPTTFAGCNRRARGWTGDEADARRLGLVTQHDDDFLARTEPVAEPRGGGLNDGASGYAEGLRGTRAERRASRRGESHTEMRKAFVVGAGVMGAAVVAAAAFTILVLAGLVTVSSGVGGIHRTATLAHPPPVTTPPAPGDATEPLFPGDATAAFPPGTTAQTGRLPQSSSNRTAVPRATTGAQVAGGSSSNSSVSAQPSSASSNPSDASAPVSSTAPAGCSKGRQHNQASRCPKN
jgi:hypothetical protein